SAALLRLAGRWAFWPQPLATPAGAGGQSWLGRLAARHVLPDVWKKLGPALLRRPGLIWSASVLALAPFVVIALWHSHDQIYNPISELPPDAPSTRPARTRDPHFPPGTPGPLRGLLTTAWLELGVETVLGA